MKKVKIQDAIGTVLSHDVTRIIKDQEKGVAFKKGHIVTEEDLPELLKIGKDHIFVYSLEEGKIHENDAALRLANVLLNEGMRSSEIKEGKVEIVSDVDGFFQVDVERLAAVNETDEVMIAVRKGNLPVKAGDKLAGTRVIPLTVHESVVERVEEICKDGPLLKITPFLDKKYGVVTTGNELYHKRIEDTFTPVIHEKFSPYQASCVDHLICADDEKMIVEAIEDLIEKGAKVVVCTGGMSVDPDDVTPTAISQIGAEIITYGSPVLPGAMLLLAYRDDVTILGVPSCAMYHKITVFDLILPYIMADQKLSKKDLAKWGYGGLCLNCLPCHYPNCQFGKGV